jgi:hypothetical protein
MKGNHLTVQRSWPVIGMSAPARLFRWFGLGLLLVQLAAPRISQADTTRTQTIALHKGWNSVFLQVSPTNRDPSSIFANTPVDIVATYFAVQKAVQYIQNPGSIGWNKSGWGVWYAANRSDSFLSSLYAIQGNHAFLIFSKQDFTWTVTGNVEFVAVRWKNDSYNLVGFGVDQSAPPTFDQFFAPSAAHQPYRIYRLVNNQWVKVVDPVHTTMQSGEACWIYCTGGSDYQGPVRLKTQAGQNVDLTTGTDSWLSFANLSTFPVNIRVEPTAADIGLPLSYTIRGIAQGTILPVAIQLPSSYQLPTLEAGDNTSFWLKIRREDMINTTQSTLLKITTDNGQQMWVPVMGSRPDLTVAQ